MDSNASAEKVGRMVVSNFEVGVVVAVVVVRIVKTYCLRYCTQYY